jgi:UbiD family decarboxylase
MAHHTKEDLRSALDLLRDKNELAEVRGEVHWDRELGTLTREALRRKGPALLFTNIAGYNKPDTRCGRLATSMLASHRRIALLTGFDELPEHDKLISHVLRKNQERVKPVLVDDGEVQSTVVTGSDVDLEELPVPRWHHLDGGRYINTFGAVVTKDPEDGSVNVGVYRGMIADRDKIAVLLVPSQHWGLHWAKHRERGRPMQVACIYGWHPIMDFLAGSPIPKGVCEYDVMGAYLNAPVPLVRCRTVDLEVPASAEIVVEGTIDPDPNSYLPEGPFGEFTGYISDVPTPRPVISVSAVTHRPDPIFRGTLEGSLPGAGGENSFMSSIQRAAIAWRLLETAGVPGVLNVFVHPVTNGTTVVVQIKKVNEGHAKWVATALWSSNAALFRYKNVIVVDEDIDPSDYSAIDWAIAYRVRPGSDDLVIFPGTFGSPLDPSTPLEDRSVPELGAGLWNRLLIDATKTWRYPARPEWRGEKFPPTVANAPEDIERVQRRWSEYRFANWDGAHRTS